MTFETIGRRSRTIDPGETAALIRRLLVGGLFVGHGLQKLAGILGGAGLDRTGETFESVGLRPGRTNAIAAGTAETVGGGLLALGLATPAAVAATSGVTITAMRTVHARNGIWATDGGIEYTAVLTSALFAIAERGPGAVSLDRLLGAERAGTPWALGAIAAGAAGSTAAIARARRQPPSAPASP